MNRRAFIKTAIGGGAALWLPDRSIVAGGPGFPFPGPGNRKFAAAGYTLVAHVAGSGASTFTTAGINTTGANLLFFAVASYTGSADATVSDSKANSYTNLNQYRASGPYIETFYKTTPTVGTGHTFT